MEHTLKLDDNSRLVFVPTTDGLMVQLYQPATIHDGHGPVCWYGASFVLKGNAHLSRAHMQQLFAALLVEED